MIHPRIQCKPICKTMLGTMCTVFQSLQAQSLRFQTKMDAINDLMDTCGVR